MRIRFVGLLIAFAAALTLAAAAQTRPAQTMLEAAKKTEVVDRDVKGAIQQYQLIVDKYGKTDPAAAAKALLGMAECYQKLGDVQANTLYEQLVRDFADLPEGAEARTRLALAGNQGKTTDVPGSTWPSEAIRSRVGQFPGLSDFAPDGKYVVLVAMTGGGPTAQNTLVLRRLDTGQDVSLASLPSGEIVGAIRFAPDGRHVAISVARAVQDVVSETLVVADVTKPASKPLEIPGLVVARNEVSKWADEMAWGTRLSWSADGSRIAYLAPSDTPHRLQCRILNVETGQIRSLNVVVEDKPDFRWSPRGALAIHVASGERDDLVVIDANGAQRSVSVSAAAAAVTYTGAQYSSPLTRLGLWTADEQIALSQRVGPGHWVVSLLAPETGRVTKGCEGNHPYLVSLDALDWTGEGGNGRDQCLQVTNDGSAEIIWKASSKHLVVHEFQTGTEHSLTIGSGEEDFGFVSPDGRTIVFVSDRDRGWGLYAAPVAKAAVARPALLTKLDGTPQEISVRWTNDGLVAAWRMLEQQVLRINVDPTTGRATSEPERLTHDYTESFRPAVSPDGRRIAYFAATGARTGLAVMDADGSNERIVSEFRVGSFAPSPVWRSNEEVIVAPWRLGPTGALDVLVVNVKTGENKVIVPALTNASGLQYLRPTDEVTYVAEPTRASVRYVVHAVSLATGQTRNVIEMEGPSDQNPLRVCFSPDATKFAYLLARDSKDPNSYEFGIVTLADGRRTVIATNRGENMEVVTWSPDGRLLVYGDGADRAPWVLDTTAVAAPVARGNPVGAVPVLGAPGQLSGWMMRTGSFAPSGQFFVVSESGEVGDSRQWHGLTAATLAKAVGR